MNATPDDYCLKFKLSKESQKYCRAASKAHSGSEMPNALRESIQNNFNDSVELEHLIWLRKSLPHDVHIHTLIERCDIILPSPKIQPRNAQLEARIQKLRRMEEERKYKEMTRNVDPIRARQPDDTVAHQCKI